MSLIFSPYSTYQAGGFFSAEDADSLPSQSDTHKQEGAFCVWEEKEIRELLLEEQVTTKSGEKVPVSFMFLKHYGVESEGNVKPHQVGKTSKTSLEPQNVINAESMICLRQTSLVYVLQVEVEISQSQWELFLDWLY